MQWIEAELGITSRTARNFVNVYEHFKMETVSDLNASPTVLYLLSAPSVDDETREVAVDLMKSGDMNSVGNAKTFLQAAKPPQAAPPANQQNGHAPAPAEYFEDDDADDDGLSIDDVREGQQEALASRAANATIVHDTLSTAAPAVNEDDLTDDEWLGTLPIVQYFVGANLPTVALKRAALSWRTLHLSKALSQWKHQAARAIKFADLLNGSELEKTVYAAANLPHPQKWMVCNCKGRGCSNCNSTGFRLNVGIDPARLAGGAE